MVSIKVGMKPLSERDENLPIKPLKPTTKSQVGMKPLSERDENILIPPYRFLLKHLVGMKPLSERDENKHLLHLPIVF